MKKIKKRFVALGLIAAMLLSLGGCSSGSGNGLSGSPESSPQGSLESQAEQNGGGESRDGLEWLNTEGGMPIVKEGTEKTLKIAYLVSDDRTGKDEDTWAYKYIVNEMNINVECIPFTDENKDEFISLTFAGGDLPDIIIGAGLSADQIVKFGEVEGQIIDMSSYLNDTYMPNVTELFQNNPELKDVVTNTAGKIYSLGYFANPKERGYIFRAFLNYDWLEECSLEVPATLEDFLAAMRTFKEKGLCDYPIGGSYACETPFTYLLNAFGYIGEYNKIGLRNGKVVLPMADREAFGEYLKLMNQCYEEGLIHPDFYTMDATTTKAVLAADAGLITQAPFVYTSNYTQYWSALPLTSEWNNTASIWSSGYATAGNVLITSSCSDPELAAKFIDYFYTMDQDAGYRLFINGPSVDQPELYYDVVTTGWSVEDNKIVINDYENNKDKWENTSAYQRKVIQLWANSKLGADSWGWDSNSPSYLGEEDWSKYEDSSVLRKSNPVVSENVEKCFRVAMQTVMSKYRTDEVFPAYAYLNESDSMEMSTIKTALDEYADQEIAKFVTGAREVSDEELNNYFDTMESLGASEYVQTYADYYAAMK